MEPASPALSPVTTGRRAVIATSIGNSLEWYDFSVYAFFAVYIGQAVFRHSSSGAQTLQAFMAFGIGFVARPLGALLIGAYGDYAGRKAALILTILLMAVGTGVMAFTPGYAAIGIGAPIMIVCGRVLQGFSAGGEIGGATAFLIEHAPADKKGLYASWIQASMALSNVLAALVATCVTLFLTKGQVASWGWRIPFLVGLGIGPVGIWLLTTMDETPEFQKEMERAHREQESLKTPLLQVVRQCPGALLVGTGFSVLWAVCVYTLIIYTPTYVQRVMHFESRQAFLASFIGNCLMVGSCVFAGSLSDRFGRRRVLGFATVLMLVGIYPLLVWLGGSHSTASLILVQSAFCVMVALFVGVAPATLAGIFPTRVRSSGMSLSYNFAVMIFGGFAPAILTWLTNRPGGGYAPAWYVMAACAVALVALLFLPPESAGHPAGAPSPGPGGTSATPRSTSLPQPVDSPQGGPA
jgi:MHS family proline/betaine transporter-like MFS transporter